MENELLNIPFIANEKIANICTYKTQGEVKGVFYPQNEKQLIFIYNYLIKHKLPFKIVGNGSNLLIKDKCDYLFICTKKIQDKIRIVDDFAYISSSTALAKAFNACYKKGLSGFEVIAGIPASIGGALQMNASAFGSSIMDIVEKIKVFKDGKIKYLKKEDIAYSYHSSKLSDCLILSAKFKLKHEKTCEILNTFGKFAKLRADKQPKGFSCGSVFKNPPNFSAGKLIEECNLKGKKIGGAVISEKHGNFILNHNNATFEDVKGLLILCQAEVYRKFKIKLQPEVEIIE